MAKMNLLEMVQSILNDMDSDEVGSISDTIEAGQVASILKDTYFELLVNIDKVPENKELFKLTALSDLDRPNYLKIPTNVTSLDWFKYNKTDDSQVQFGIVRYKCPEDFTNMVFSLNSTDANVQKVTDFSGIELLVRNDKEPEWYTTFDDEHLVMDSFDSGVEATLQAHKTLAYGQVEPAWSATDSFVPDLDSNLFPLLLSEAKSKCFVNLKQSANPKQEQIARRQLVATQNNKHRLTDRNKSPRPDYGR